MRMFNNGLLPMRTCLFQWWRHFFEYMR